MSEKLIVNIEQRHGTLAQFNAAVLPEGVNNQMWWITDEEVVGIIHADGKKVFREDRVNKILRKDDGTPSLGITGSFELKSGKVYRMRVHFDIYVGDSSWDMTLNNQRWRLTPNIGGAAISWMENPVHDAVISGDVVTLFDSQLAGLHGGQIIQVSFAALGTVPANSRITTRSEVYFQMVADRTMNFTTTLDPEKLSPVYGIRNAIVHIEETQLNA